MENPTSSELTKRQLYGFEYMQYTKKVDRKTNVSRNGVEYNFQLHGKAKEAPEIENLVLSRNGMQAHVVYHDLDKFVVTGNGSGKKIDLVAITPPDWSQKTIDLISPQYKAPEIHDAFGKYQVIDVKRKECVTSNMMGSDDPDEVDFAVKSGLWNTLIAKFISEVGDPANDEAKKGMRDSVLQRRTEVLDALGGKSEGDPQEIALRSFGVEQK